MEVAQPVNEALVWKEEAIPAEPVLKAELDDANKHHRRKYERKQKRDNRGKKKKRTYVTEDPKDERHASRKQIWATVLLRIVFPPLSFPPWVIPSATMIPMMTNKKRKKEKFLAEVAPTKKNLPRWKYSFKQSTFLST